ncbi:MAG: Phenylacetic acid catabolic protein [Pseudomonadota bacterium]|nr:Phenylacetic acid catabolic protein [Pseudomonadota bacterium]
MDTITSTSTISGPEGATGEYKEMLVRLMTRQIYAETATAEVFGRAISVAPNWQEKELAAEFAAEEARHSRGLYDLLTDLGEDPEAIIASRPDASSFWGLDMEKWIDIAVFNFTVDRAGSHQIMEYRQSSYLPWGDSQEEVLEDEEDHYDNGVENMKQFASDPVSLAEFQEVFDRVLPNCLKRAFGRLEGPDNSFCLEHGLKRNKTENIVNRYLGEMRGHMEGTGLMFPLMSEFEDIKCELADSTREILLSMQR